MNWLASCSWTLQPPEWSGIHSCSWSLAMCSILLQWPNLTQMHMMREKEHCLNSPRTECQAASACPQFHKMTEAHLKSYLYILGWVIWEPCARWLNSCAPCAWSESALLWNIHTSTSCWQHRTDWFLRSFCWVISVNSRLASSLHHLFCSARKILHLFSGFRHTYLCNCPLESAYRIDTVVSHENLEVGWLKLLSES